MKFIMMFSAVYAAGSGIFLVLGFGLLMPASDAFVAQLGGAGLVGMGVLNWSARNMKEEEAFRPIVLANFVYSTIAFIVILLGLFFGAASGLRWTTVAIYLGFALYFALVLFRKPGKS